MTETSFAISHAAIRLTFLSRGAQIKHHELSHAMDALDSFVGQKVEGQLQFAVKNLCEL